MCTFLSLGSEEAVKCVDEDYINRLQEESLRFCFCEEEKICYFACGRHVFVCIFFLCVNSAVQFLIAKFGF